MSLPRNGLQLVPVETARVAQAAFPDGNVYLRLRDELGTLFDDELFTAVYAIEGHPALHPWPLGPVSRRPNSTTRIRRGAALKAPSLKPRVPLACGERATLGSARRIFSISSRP